MSAETRLHARLRGRWGRCSENKARWRWKKAVVGDRHGFSPVFRTDKQGCELDAKG